MLAPGWLWLAGASIGRLDVGANAPGVDPEEPSIGTTAPTGRGSGLPGTGT